MFPADHGVIVCDNGTGSIKCGWAGSECPAFSIPSLIGRPNLRLVQDSGSVRVKNLAVGDEASSCRAGLNVSYPMEKGFVRNWEDMTRLWDYAFGPDKMAIDAGSSKILLTEAPMDSPKNREKLVELMFERYGFDSAYVAGQGVLTLFAQGFHTGVVVDSGDGVTYVCPVFAGSEISHGSIRLDVAGRDVTRYLIELLQQRGYVFNQSADFETVREMKEQLCYVANDLRLENRLALETTALTKTFTLPDGRVVRLDAERYRAPEALFRPSLIGVEGVGVPEAVFNAISNADLSTRPQLYQHIVLSGGTSLFPGLPSRLKADIERLYLERVVDGNVRKLKSARIRVHTRTDRMNAVFIGGSMLAYAASNCPEFWLSRRDYEEHGVKIIDQIRHTTAKLSVALLQKFHEGPKLSTNKAEKRVGLSVRE